MNDQDNLTEKNESLSNQSAQNATPRGLSDTDIQRLSILRLKTSKDFQETLKKATDQEKINLQKKFNDLYQDKFGELTVSRHEIEELKQLESINSSFYKKKIEKLNYELAQAPPRDNFENFPMENDPIAIENPHLPTNEEVRIAFNLLPDKLKAIFKNYFKVTLSRANWNQNCNNQLSNASGGAIIEPYTEKGIQKYNIVVDADSCYEKETKYYDDLPVTMTYFNLKKLNYLIVRSMLATIEDKEEFDNYLKKKKYNKKIDKNCPNNVDDWLALCLSDSETGKEFGKEQELYNKAIEWLNNSFDKEKLTPKTPNPNNRIIKTRDIDKSVLKEKTTKYKDSQTDTQLSDTWHKILGFTDKIKIPWLGKALYTATKMIPFTLERNDENYYFLIADLDQKEVKKLLSLEKTGGDYIKMLSESRYYHDKEKMRHILLVIAQKGAYQSWMAHLWLNKHDRKYRQTRGKEISKDAFDFITRLAKDASKGLKSPLRAEYRQTPQGTYVRQSFKSQVEALDNIFNQMSLREIQRISADVYGNNFQDDKKEFIDINKKLEINDQDEGKVYVNSLDGNLCNLIGRKEAHSFVNNMKTYSQEIGENKLLNLANPLVVALTRRYVQASREEPTLFNMFTAPMIRDGFNKYKNVVGETQYSIKDYDKNFQKHKEQLEANNFDIEKVVEANDFDNLKNIFKEFTKEKTDQPFVSGLKTTQYGKIIEFVSQAKEKVSEIYLPKEIKSFINAKMDQASAQDIISTEYINRLHKEIEEKTINLEPSKKNKLNVELDNFFKHLASIGVIKQYQAVFRPYTSHLHNYLAVNNNHLDESQKDEFKKWYYHELLPTNNQSIEDKIKNIEMTYPQISISDKDKQIILQKQPNEAINYLSDTINKELSHINRSGKENFASDYSMLNNLWLQANEAIQYPDQYKGDVDLFINQFQKLNLVPPKDKTDDIIHYKQLLHRLKLAKIVADDYYEQLERSKQNAANRRLMGYLSSDEIEQYEEYEI